MNKIDFLVLHLGYGGVEKAIISQANLLCEDYDVEIISTYKLYDQPPFYIDSRVKVKYLLEDLAPNRIEFVDALKKISIMNVIREGFKALKILYLRKHTMAKYIRQSNADYIVSSRYLYNSILGRNRSGSSVAIAEEHRHHNNDKKYIRRLLKSLNNIDLFLPVSNELTKFYSKELKETNTKCEYIKHFLDDIPENVSSLEENNIVTVCRLSREKGILDLIDVFKLVIEKHPNWKWHIIGDGDQKSEIERKIEHLKITDNIVMHGFQNKEYVNKILSKSSIYMMGSFEESFGLVLIEAQSYGIPCVAFDSAQGANEIISVKNGFLIKDRSEKEMANKICLLINNQQLRHDKGKASRENSLTYSKELIKNEWIHMLEKNRHLRRG